MATFLCDICGQIFQNWLVFYVHGWIHGHSNNKSSFEAEDSQKQGSNTHQQSITSDRQNTINRQQARSSVIQYAPPTRDTCIVHPKLKVELMSSALGNRVYTSYIIRNVSNENIDRFLNDAAELVLQTISKESRRLHLLKFNIVLETEFINIDNDLSPRSFIARTREVNADSNVEAIGTEVQQELMLKVTEHEGRGSGWSLKSVQRLVIRIYKQGYGHRGSKYIPLPSKIAATHSVINIKNNDDRCFNYAMLCKYIEGANLDRPDARYRQAMWRYNFNSLEYPVSLKGVKTFERNNIGVSVNVFGLDDRSNVYPMRIVNELNDHTDLLFIQKDNEAHFTYIKDINRLLNTQFKCKRNRVTFICKRCFSKTYLPGIEGKNWLREHTRLCGKYTEAKVILPTKQESVLCFKKVSSQYKVPIAIYADFESTLLPIHSAQRDDCESFTDKYQMHEPNSFCYVLKSNLPLELLQEFDLPMEPRVYRGGDPAKVFITELKNIAEKVQRLYQINRPMEDMNAEALERYNNATECYLCGGAFTEQDYKVRDHDHLNPSTGINAAHLSCNLNYKIPSFLPVLLHNAGSYDFHMIIPELCYDDQKIDVIASTTEKFISVSKAVGDIKLRFLDSYKFMSSSLSVLVENMQLQDLIETKRLVSEDKIDLVLRKGVYPYDYIDSLDRFNERCLPPRECFYNRLEEKDISEEEYLHAKRVWEEMKFNNLGEYSDFYVKLDVTLLADVMEHFRKTSMTAYGLDPLHFYTAPGLSWQAMLKQTKCKLELLTDSEMLLMIESGVRGGITQCIKRYVKANNKYLPDYNPDEDSTYLGYFDSNNLYGWAMVNPLPQSDFRFVDPESIEDILSIPQHGDKGYILECDVIYPETVHDLHCDLPLLPLSEKPPNGKYAKLLTTLSNKEKYVAHYWTFQQAIRLGLKVSKIHRAIEFSQSCWLEPYIRSNTTRRAQATNNFDKDFPKLMNNSIFGKTLQNKRLYKDLRLVTNEEKFLKLTQKSNFNSAIRINDNMVAVSMHKTKVKMDLPLYVGFSILDISKWLMYDFHYNKMLPYYGRSRLEICYTDTDAFLYKVITDDLYEDLRTFEHKDEFDFSDYPPSHPAYDTKNKKVLGKFKDEVNSAVISEFVGLRAKMYALNIKRDNKSVIKKAKGIKTSYLNKNVTFDHYKECLLEGRVFKANFNTIRSFNHSLYSINQNKTSLSPFDDKRHILANGIDTLPHGHYSLNNIGE